MSKTGTQESSARCKCHPYNRDSHQEEDNCVYYGTEILKGKNIQDIHCWKICLTHRHCFPATLCSQTWPFAAHLQPCSSTQLTVHWCPLGSQPLQFSWPLPLKERTTPSCCLKTAVSPKALTLGMPESSVTRHLPGQWYSGRHLCTQVSSETLWTWLSILKSLTSTSPILCSKGCL